MKIKIFENNILNNIFTPIKIFADILILILLLNLAQYYSTSAIYQIVFSLLVFLIPMLLQGYVCYANKERFYLKLFFAILSSAILCAFIIGLFYVPSELLNNSVLQTIAPFSFVLYISTTAIAFWKKLVIKNAPHSVLKGVLKYLFLAPFVMFYLLVLFNNNPKMSFEKGFNESNPSLYEEVLDTEGK
jgi:hypothetical protein